MSEMDLSIIVITRNRADSLPACLQHLEVQEFPAARFEIVVVDNASTDGTPETVRRYALGSPVSVRCIQLNQRAPWARARNLAAHEARGRWLLLLDEDLLASPRLASRHVQVHKDSATPSVLMGALAFHPQMDRMTLTKWFLPEFRKPDYLQGDLEFLQWRAYNMSLPRDLLLNSGGFDEDFQFPHFGTAELGWRLVRQGVPALLLDDAPAYIWRPIGFSAARDRYYSMGYNLHTLIQKTGEHAVLGHFAIERSPLRRAYERLLMPYLTLLCARMEPDSPTAIFYLRRILRYELYRGFTDAAQARAPRPLEE